MRIAIGSKVGVRSMDGPLGWILHHSTCNDLVKVNRCYDIHEQGITSGHRLEPDCVESGSVVKVLKTACGAGHYTIHVIVAS